MACSVWLAALAVGLSACGRDDTIEVETLELADGDFSGLTWGGTQVERFYVLARRGTTDAVEDEVVIVTPNREEPCSLGQLALYNTQQPRTGAKFVLGSPSPARISIFDNADAEGFGRLSFVDVNCRRKGPELEGVRLREPFHLYQPDFTALELAVLDRQQSLHLVDPWENETKQVAEDVRQVVQVTDGAWLREGGKLVKRDFEGRELRRLGTDVSDFLLLAGGDDIAYIDAGKLVVRRAGKTEELASDACGLRGLDGFMPSALSYFSPCDSGRLVVSPVVGKPFVYAGPIDAYTAQLGRLVIVRENGSATTLETVFAQEPAVVRPWASLPPVQVEDVWPVAGAWLVRANAPEAGRQLIRLTNEAPSRDPIFLATGILGFASGKQRALAWLQDRGALTLTDPTGTEVLFRTRDVNWFRFVFDRGALALLYITDRDAETGAGRLHLRLLSGESFVLDDDVREPQEVWWPERGILYVHRGERPGIRFARVDLPCATTSDSPWACGF